MSKSFILIGAGKVGRSLGKWLKEVGFELKSVFARSERYDQLLESKVYLLNSKKVERADFFLIAVPESALLEIVPFLSHNYPDIPVVYTSANILPKELYKHKVEATLLHPLRSFPTVLDFKVAKDTFFAISGNDRSSAIALEIVNRLGASWAKLKEEKLRIYHLAATLAAGGVATLMSLSIFLSEKIGLPDKAKKGLISLAKGVVNNFDFRFPVSYITGPVARGEEIYLEELNEIKKEKTFFLTAVYLALATIELKKRYDTFTPKDKILEKQLLKLTRDKKNYKLKDTPK